MEATLRPALGGRLSWIESGQGFLYLRNEKHKIGKESGLHLPKWNDSRTRETLFYLQKGIVAGE